MLLDDGIDFKGVFSLKEYDINDNLIGEYSEKNLIMDGARTNMAQLVGGVNTGGTAAGLAINKLVLGTRGHRGTNILDFQKVGEVDNTKPTGNRSFDSGRTRLFSEAISGQINYRITFNAAGGSDVTVNANGRRYSGNIAQGSNQAGNTVRRVVNDRTVTYTITIPVTNANSGVISDPIVPYTEAALYAGDEIFSMKTFPARVKEDTVKFEISWSIIF